jgi:GntR family transcriptional repressor for pyruvate dehydrogenase complex
VRRVVEQSVGPEHVGAPATGRPWDGSSGQSPSDLPVQRVRSSYMQVAEQLRDLIVRGDLRPGRRLPSEAEMAPLFGASRSTIREALRILATDGLVETRRGVHGGTFVVEVDTAHIEGLLNSTLNLLAVTEGVGVADFLEAWQAIEAPATALAARNATSEDVAALARLSAPVGPSAARSDELSQSADFHAAVLHASGSLLFEAMGRPVSAVARAHLLSTDPPHEFFRSVNVEHRHIAEAIADGDATTARGLAVEHIEGLRSYYASPRREPS